MTIYNYKPYINERRPEYIPFRFNIIHLLKYFGVFIFMLTGVGSFHQAYSTLKAPTVRRTYKMGGYSLLGCYVVCVIFASFAYFSYG